MVALAAPHRSAVAHSDQQGHYGAAARRSGDGAPARGHTVKGSRLANLKELRPGSTGCSEVRLLFVFDPLRRAVFLVGGDKAGDWHGWYLTAVPRAEKAYEDYLTELEEDTE
ncbi:type II toxin-antitoxin system RelE/ParE family toxin [Streptomyces sp. NPDC059525]|uniref:type II toxin-antitoxin system RelE/ParE family toxin n=1 Tax=Streptomyces sp. NPDC059525 TaxID=3346857 RepID=UPI0036A08D88